MLREQVTPSVPVEERSTVFAHLIGESPETLSQAKGEEDPRLPFESFPHKQETTRRDQATDMRYRLNDIGGCVQHVRSNHDIVSAKLESLFDRIALNIQ